MKRYFIVNMHILTKGGETGFASINIITDGKFPNDKIVKARLKEQDTDNLVISSVYINIQELSEQDFKDFIEK